MAQGIPELTVRTLARTFFAHGHDYGFCFEDYVHFVNALLELAIEADNPVTELPPDPGDLPLQGENITVRELHDTDRPILRGWMADPRGRYFLLSRTTGQSMSVDELLDDADNAIGIIATPDDAPVGALVFLRQDRQAGKAELRKIVGEPSQRGHGIGTEATRLWVAWGLRTLGLRKIYLYTLATNHHNISLNEALGFRVEGILRNEVFIDNAHHDLFRMGLVMSD